MNTQAKVIEQLLSKTGIRVNGSDPWDNKYIFPNGMLPSIADAHRKGQDILPDSKMNENYDRLGRERSIAFVMNAMGVALLGTQRRDL